MGLERVLEYSFGLFKRDIKVVLPNVLSWIPTALFTLIIFQATESLSQFVSVGNFGQILTDTSLLWQIFKTILGYALIALPVIVLSAIISVFLSCVYADIIRQDLKKKKVTLADAFGVAKTKFLPLLWTYVLEFFIGLAGFLALVGIAIIGGILGIVLAILLGLAAIFMIIIFFFETPAVVVLENKSGFEAIKRSYEIGRKNIGSLFIVILIAGIILQAITSGLAGVPYVGIILTTLASLLLDAWRYMIPNIFYYEYSRKT